jgi:integrase
MLRKTFTHEGKRHDVTAATEKELIVKVAMKKRDLEEGKKRITKNMLVRDWAGEYIEVYRRPSVGSDMYRDLTSQNRVWIIPHIGNLQLKDVKPLHCQKILNAMAGLSATHIKKVRQLLYAMFETALDNGLVQANPAKHLVSPKAESGTHRSITDAERKYLSMVCETHEHGLWIKIMLHCGLRPSETARIMGRHVDLTNKKLFVDGTKSKAAKRWVPIPDGLAEDLKKIPLTPFGPVFKNRNGAAINRTNRGRMWQSVKKSMHVAMGGKLFNRAIVPPNRVAPDLVPYCLRHTYATDLDNAGVRLNEAKVLLGHSDISVTAPCTEDEVAVLNDNGHGLPDSRCDVDKTLAGSFECKISHYATSL